MWPLKWVEKSHQHNAKQKTLGDSVYKRTQKKLIYGVKIKMQHFVRVTETGKQADISWFLIWVWFPRMCLLCENSLNSALWYVHFFGTYTIDQWKKKCYWWKRVDLKFCFIESHMEFLKDHHIRKRGSQSKRVEARWIRLRASKHSDARAVLFVCLLIQKGRREGPFNCICNAMLKISMCEREQIPRCIGIFCFKPSLSPHAPGSWNLHDWGQSWSLSRI